MNVSPKDRAALRILSPQRVAYLDQTGSGNETAAHLRAHGRLTLMFCAFAGAPLILRLMDRVRLCRGAASPTLTCWLLHLITKSVLDLARSLCSISTWSKLPVDTAFRYSIMLRSDPP